MEFITKSKNQENIKNKNKKKIQDTNNIILELENILNKLKKDVDKYKIQSPISQIPISQDICQQQGAGDVTPIDMGIINWRNSLRNY